MRNAILNRTHCRHDNCLGRYEPMKGGHRCSKCEDAVDDTFKPIEAADELTALRERVAELEGALASARHYVAEAVDVDGGIDACEIHMRHDLEAIDAILAKQGGEGV